MGVKILWYLTLPDGPVPWEPEGRWEGGFEHLQQLAGAIDKLGFYGALLATGFGGNEVLTVASSVIGVTRRMKFLAAIHPGLLSPAKLAQIALTIDNFSGGRLLFNAVNGNDATLPAFGVHYGHDERYDFSLEYWEAFKASYLGQEKGYEGKYIKLAPRPLMGGRVRERGSPGEAASGRCSPMAWASGVPGLPLPEWRTRSACSTCISASRTRRPSSATSSGAWGPRRRRLGGR